MSEKGKKGLFSTVECTFFSFIFFTQAANRLLQPQFRCRWQQQVKLPHQNMGMNITVWAPAHRNSYLSQCPHPLPTILPSSKALLKLGNPEPSINSKLESILLCCGYVGWSSRVKRVSHSVLGTCRSGCQTCKNFASSLKCGIRIRKGLYLHPVWRLKSY